MILAGDVLSGILRDRTRPIVLEITEHQPIGDYAATREAVAALGADVKLAVDDVGAGVANFSHLVELRPDFLKVDASLVRGLHADVTRQALIVGLRHFALATNTLIIAEGIETSAERDALMQLDIQYGQRFLYGRPDRASTLSLLEAHLGPVAIPRARRASRSRPGRHKPTVGAVPRPR